jgi:hypothetical protein
VRFLLTFADNHEDVQDAPLTPVPITEDILMFVGTTLVSSRLAAELEAPWRLPGSIQPGETPPLLARRAEGEEEDIEDDEEEDEDDEDEDLDEDEDEFEDEFEDDFEDEEDFDDDEDFEDLDEDEDFDDLDEEDFDDDEDEDEDEDEEEAVDGEG